MKSDVKFTFSNKFITNSQVKTPLSNKIIKTLKSDLHKNKVKILRHKSDCRLTDSVPLCVLRRMIILLYIINTSIIHTP